MYEGEIHKNKPTALLVSLIVAVSLLILSALYVTILLLPQVSQLEKQTAAKYETIAALNNELSYQTVEITDLKSSLHEAKEAVLILEREITTFGVIENTDNLINRNSLFKTIQQIELLAEADVDSEVVHTVETDVTGEVKDGPRLLGESAWWQVAFKDGEEGWVSEDNLERIPSVVIRIDLDQDGEPDIKMRWEGEYDLDGIVAEPGVDGTYIRYKGEAMPEPFEVIEL